MTKMTEMTTEMTTAFPLNILNSQFQCRLRGLNQLNNTFFLKKKSKFSPVEHCPKSENSKVIFNHLSMFEVKNFKF